MLYLIAFMLLEPVKRILSAILYPIVYPVRRALRNENESLWSGYLYQPTWCWIAWLLLDDSIYMETGEDCARQDSKYPGFVLKHNWMWLRCYWWSAIRNSFVNWNNLNAYLLGGYIGDVSHYGSDINFYKTRLFTNGRRPYCEFWLFGRWNQVGWIKAARFEIDIMKEK